MNKPDTSRRALGRGIGSLLPTRTQAAPAASPAPELPNNAPAHEDAAQTVPIANIDANPLQPRRTFQSDKLAELAQSIRVNGIIQPLVVRKAPDGTQRLQLVAGERRLRAAKLAGLESVPVVIQEISDEHLLEITLIENIQREDLNPIETAIAFERLGTTLNLSPEEIGRRTGKDRSTILNSIRLLQLPQDIQSVVAEGKLTAGHARCLLKLPDSDMQREVAAKAVEQDWSVRQLERTTAKMIEGGVKKTAEEVALDPNVKAAILEMERVLGTKVRIVEKAGHKGRIEIDYYSSEDLDRIYEVIVPQD
jgi:ParB family chromosome partitioning protein